MTFKKTKEFILAEKEAYRKLPDMAFVYQQLLKAKRKGDPFAYYGLASWYIYGNQPFVRKNLKEAVKHLKVAAEKGHKDALHDLACSYETGKGIRKSEKKAFEYYMAAALAGNADAFEEVARMYYWGRGTKRNRFLAEIWGKKYKEVEERSARVPSRDEIIDLLVAWRKGKRTAKYVQEFAEELYESLVFVDYPQNSYESIAVECIIVLEDIKGLWVTKEDIPEFLAFLETPKGKELEGWGRWYSYWTNLDLQKRKKDLIGKPFYQVNHFTPIKR